MDPSLPAHYSRPWLSRLLHPRDLLLSWGKAFLRLSNRLLSAHKTNGCIVWLKNFSLSRKNVLLQYSFRGDWILYCLIVFLYQLLSLAKFCFIHVDFYVIKSYQAFTLFVDSLVIFTTIAHSQDFRLNNIWYVNYLYEFLLYFVIMFNIFKFMNSNDHTTLFITFQLAVALFCTVDSFFRIYCLKVIYVISKFIN